MFLAVWCIFAGTVLSAWALTAGLGRINSHLGNIATGVLLMGIVFQVWIVRPSLVERLDKLFEYMLISKGR